MNKTQRIRAIKKELDEIDMQFALIESMKQSITCRKIVLTEELEAVGASAPPRKGKNQISIERRLAIRANITKGALPWKNTNT